MFNYSIAVNKIVTKVYWLVEQGLAVKRVLLVAIPLIIFFVVEKTSNLHIVVMTYIFISKYFPVVLIAMLLKKKKVISFVFSI